MSFVVGIDPGLHGGIAFLSLDTQDIAVFDTPVIAAAATGKNSVDIQTLLRILRERKAMVSHAFIEQVSARPGQGVVSMFNFGMTYGLTLGALAAMGIPYTLVTPGRWKKTLQVPAAKDGAIARANQLLPQHSDRWPLKKHDGRAEAALLALYGIQSEQRTQNHVGTLADLLA